MENGDIHMARSDPIQALEKLDNRAKTCIRICARLCIVHSLL